MNTRYYMVVIKGEIKTSEIMSCVYNRNTQKWDVKFNTGKTYVDYAKSERQFRVNGAAVPFPTAHQRRSLFIDFITLAHAYSVHSFQDGKNAFCQ